jgi:hypothetical protein
MLLNMGGPRTYCLLAILLSSLLPHRAVVRADTLRCLCPANLDNAMRRRNRPTPPVC